MAEESLEIVSSGCFVEVSHVERHMLCPDEMRPPPCLLPLVQEEARERSPPGAHSRKVVQTLEERASGTYGCGRVDAQHARRVIRVRVDAPVAAEHAAIPLIAPVRAEVGANELNGGVPGRSRVDAQHARSVVRDRVDAPVAAEHAAIPLTTPVRTEVGADELDGGVPGRGRVDAQHARSVVRDRVEAPVPAEHAAIPLTTPMHAEVGADGLDRRRGHRKCPQAEVQTCMCTERRARSVKRTIGALLRARLTGAADNPRKVKGSTTGAN